MMLSSPLPFPYFHLICLLVHFTALCSSLSAGLNLGTAPGFSVHQVLAETTTTLVGGTLYCGMLCLAVVLADPFGDDIVDFPASMFQHRLWKSQLFAGSLVDDDDLLDSELYAKLGDGANGTAKRLNPRDREGLVDGDDEDDADGDGDE